MPWSRTWLQGVPYELANFSQRFLHSSPWDGEDLAFEIKFKAVGKEQSGRVEREAMRRARFSQLAKWVL